MAVIDDGTKRRLRRGIRKHQRSATEFSQQADQQIEKLLLRRIERLVSVRRFVLLWISLFAVLFFVLVLQIRALSPYYQSLKPAAGGLFSEGLVGTFTNANPLYATNAADAAVSRLVFSSLFKYDDHGRLVGDLATNYRLSKDGTTYIVHLKPNVFWQDGQPLTADDVVFTYRTIQRADTLSPLRSSWEGIRVTKQDDHTVTFGLPDPLAAFPQSLVNGIVPVHILKNTDLQQLRSADFNTHPVGSGPFAWKFVEVSGSGTADRQQRISLIANPKYFGGRPKLDGISLTTFNDEKHLLSAYDKKQVYAISGLDSLPPALANGSAIQHQTPYASIVMAFFNNSNPILGDSKVRKALVSAVDRQPLINITGYPVNLAEAPLLRSQYSYSPKRAQLPFDLKQAKALLNQAGWRLGKDGFRHKGKAELSLTMRTQNTKNYNVTAQYIQKQWAQLGIKVDIRYYDSNDLQTVIITNHDYDILLYSISVGSDPDVFAYWDSSQASITSQGHLNLSEYKSSVADQALEAGRTRSDANLRNIKYDAFLRVWRDDAPALALYQPNFLYVTRGPLFNYDRSSDVSTNDRFNNAQSWEIRQSRQNF